MTNGLKNANHNFLLKFTSLVENNIARDSEVEKSYKFDAILANFYM